MHSSLCISPPGRTLNSLSHPAQTKARFSRSGAPQTKTAMSFTLATSSCRSLFFVIAFVNCICAGERQQKNKTKTKTKTPFSGGFSVGTARDIAGFIHPQLKRGSYPQYLRRSCKSTTCFAYIEATRKEERRATLIALPYIRTVAKLLPARERTVSRYEGCGPPLLAGHVIDVPRAALVHSNQDLLWCVKIGMYMFFVYILGSDYSAPPEYLRGGIVIRT